MAVAKKISIYWRKELTEEVRKYPALYDKSHKGI